MICLHIQKQHFGHEMIKKQVGEMHAIYKSTLYKYKGCRLQDKLCQESEQGIAMKCSERKKLIQRQILISIFFN